MAEVYRIVGICLGVPDEEFHWEYYDKDGKYHSIGPIEPLHFYATHVKPCIDLDDMVSIISDCRETSPYGRALEIEFMGNMVGGDRMLYNNQRIEFLLDLATESLKNGRPVWVTCDQFKRISSKTGIIDMNVYDFESVFGVEIEGPLSKADRMTYREIEFTHAMVFTAVTCDVSQ